MTYIRGRVDRVLHQSGTFHIIALSVYDFEEGTGPRNTKVSGHFFGVTQLCPGAVLEIEGKWGRHPKYGPQFKAHGWRPWAKSAADVKLFLSHCVSVFDATDEDLVKHIVRTKGTNAYDALSDGTVEWPDEEVLSRACEKWETVRGIATLSDMLQEYELGASLIAAVFSRFGLEAVEILSKNPYRLVEIEGMSFHRANKLALMRGIGPGDPRRIAGGVMWVVREQLKQGHLFVRRGAIASEMTHLASYENVAPFDVPDLEQAVSDALVGLEQSEALRIDGVGVYLPDTYRYEREAGRMLSNFLTPSELLIDLKTFLEDYEKGNDIDLSTDQRCAVEKLLANRVLVVTGAPGTGKTTLIRTFVRLFQVLKITHMLMAPTGIAAKRLASVTETGAQTIHRALRYDGFTWGHDNSDPLEAQAIIVDEFSMVDQELLYRLLDALPPTTLLVMVGDDAQLPSVGAGNVLRELLACPAVPHVRLEHVFRQAETSDIVLAAHCIRRGDSPLGLPKKEETEFQFVASSDEALIAKLIVKMAVKLKARDANFQVLAPKYDGIVGVDNLNTLLRDELNPNVGQDTWRLAGFEARVGDRLMVIKNSYPLNIYNGDIGKLLSITKDSLVLRVHGVGTTPDMNVEVPKDQADRMLRLAYAVTVHRCQGEEFETVIMPLVRSQGRMLQRNLFYTAITRARRKVWVLGESDAVLKAVGNDKVVKRNTILRDLVVPHVRTS